MGAVDPEAILMGGASARVAQALAGGGVEAVEEGLQETTQTAIGNVTTGDPIADDLMRSFGTGFMAGGAMSGPAAALGVTRGGASPTPSEPTPEAAPTTPEEAVASYMESQTPLAEVTAPTPEPVVNPRVSLKPSDFAQHLRPEEAVATETAPEVTPEVTPEVAPEVAPVTEPVVEAEPTATPEPQQPSLFGDEAFEEVDRQRVSLKPSDFSRPAVSLKPSDFSKPRVSLKPSESGGPGSRRKRPLIDPANVLPEVAPVTAEEVKSVKPLLQRIAPEIERRRNYHSLARDRMSPADQADADYRIARGEEMLALANTKVKDLPSGMARELRQITKRDLTGQQKLMAASQATARWANWQRVRDQVKQSDREKKSEVMHALRLADGADLERIWQEADAGKTPADLRRANPAYQEEALLKAMEEPYLPSPDELESIPPTFIADHGLKSVEGADTPTLVDKDGNQATAAEWQARAKKEGESSIDPTMCREADV